MTEATLQRILDFIGKAKRRGDALHLGLFGGEPLLAFPLLRSTVAAAKRHPASADGIEFQIITNGTLVSSEVIDFVLEEGISLGISCDGVSDVQDRFRTFADGSGSSLLVHAGIVKAIDSIPDLMVNSVYRPETIARLPEGLRYFRALGLRNIYLNPDFSATWMEADLPAMDEAYREIAAIYIDAYRSNDPFYCSLIDNKIALMLNGGYDPCDRCSMGVGEIAFTPEGRIYPCERLVGDGLTDEHCIGDLDSGIELKKLLGHRSLSEECLECTMKAMCMNNCGCSNYFSSGDYGKPGPFLCASEKAAMGTALQVFRTLTAELGPGFLDLHEKAKRGRAT